LSENNFSVTNAAKPQPKSGASQNKYLVPERKPIKLEIERYF